MVRSVLRLRCPSPEVRESLGDCLFDLAWHKLQIARECIAVCESNNWRADGEDVRYLAFLLWAKPLNTKMYLEDTFAHTSSAIKRLAKNDKMQRLGHTLSSNLSAAFRLSSCWPRNG